MTQVEALSQSGSVLMVIGICWLAWAGFSLSWIRVVVAFAFIGLALLFCASASVLSSHKGGG